MLRWAIAAAAVWGALASAFAEPARIPMLGSMPEDPGDEPFTFAVLGDKTSGGEGKWPIYDAAVDRINALDPDFVISVGDQISGHMSERALWDDEWAEYMEHARRFEPPFIMIPGNHDIANIPCYEFWREDLGATYFEFMYGNCHFLVLNTEEERLDGRGPAWERMMSFMQESLEAHREVRHTFVFFHKPMWDDPRYETTWARLVDALDGRPSTIVAGHEHYLSSERDGAMHRVLQSATGGGIRLSEVQQWGCFHSFGVVNVSGDAVDYDVVEAESGERWDVDIAPASFRRAITYDLVTFDAAPPRAGEKGQLIQDAMLRLENKLDTPIAIELSFAMGAETGWHWDSQASPDWAAQGDGVMLQRSLDAGERIEGIPLRLMASPSSFAAPPPYDYRVNVGGEWLTSDSMPMAQEHVIQPYPRTQWHVVRQWNIAGPISIGPIDTSSLPAAPDTANAKMRGQMGYEEGPAADPAAWKPVTSQGRGMLNFNAILGTEDHVAGFAHCTITSPVPQETRLVAYSDNFHLAYLNGERVVAGEDFGARGGFTAIPLALKQGENELVVKLINNKGDWFLRTLIADPNGTLSFSK